MAEKKTRTYASETRESSTRLVPTPAPQPQKPSRTAIKPVNRKEHYNLVVRLIDYLESTES